MNRVKKFWRVLQINYIFAKHGLDEVVLSIPFFAPLKFLAYLNPWNWAATKKRSRGVRVREAFEELGPIFVKFGQALSTRRDFLPNDVADELAKLQDKVPPFPGKQARQMVEKIFDKPLTSLFLSFDETPLASASVAQVHAARLFNGQQVAVKILRPNIEQKISYDLALMHILAGLADRYWKASRRFSPRTLVKNFERHLLDELDLQLEAANATQLKRNFANSTILYVPEVYWDYTRTQVMTLERIAGIPVAQVDALRAQNVNFKKLAERVVEIFFTQVFRDCFFHADMHPGNIFVDATNPENPGYIVLDFGIMGTLSDLDRRYLAENMMAFFHRDYHRVATLHVQSGWIPANTRVEEFEMAIRGVCEPVFDRPLKNISCAQLLLRLFQTGQRFNMEIQPQLVLLQKTLFNVEGLGRSLYPELDLWKTAQPCIEKWLKQQMSVRTMMHKIQNQAPYWMDKLPELPEMLYGVLSRLQPLPSVPASAPQAPIPKSTWVRNLCFFIVGFLAGGWVLRLGFDYFPK